MFDLRLFAGNCGRGLLNIICNSMTPPTAARITPTGAGTNHAAQARDGTAMMWITQSGALGM